MNYFISIPFPQESLVVADIWYPSSKWFSICKVKGTPTTIIAIHNHALTSDSQLTSVKDKRDSILEMIFLLDIHGHHLGPEIDYDGQDLSMRGFKNNHLQRAAAWRARCGPEFCNLQINKGKVAVVIAEIPLAKCEARYPSLWTKRLWKNHSHFNKFWDGNTKKMHVFLWKSGKISGNVWPILAATKRLQQSKAISPNNSVDILPVFRQLQTYRRSTLAWWMSKRFVATKNGGILKRK